jgi:hypothetical protein
MVLSNGVWYCERGLVFERLPGWLHDGSFGAGAMRRSARHNASNRANSRIDVCFNLLL